MSDDYLTATEVEIPIVKQGKEYMFTVTVLNPYATATMLNLLPDDGKIENEFVFIKENYLVLAKDVVHPSIISPKIPLEKLDFSIISSVLLPLLNISGLLGDGDEDDEFQP